MPSTRVITTARTPTPVSSRSSSPPSSVSEEPAHATDCSRPASPAPAAGTQPVQLKKKKNKKKKNKKKNKKSEIQSQETLESPEPVTSVFPFEYFGAGASVQPVGVGNRKSELQSQGTLNSPGAMSPFDYLMSGALTEPVWVAPNPFIGTSSYHCLIPTIGPSTYTPPPGYDKPRTEITQSRPARARPKWKWLLGFLVLGLALVAAFGHTGPNMWTNKSTETMSSTFNTPEVPMSTEVSLHDIASPEFINVPPCIDEAAWVQPCTDVAVWVKPCTDVAVYVKPIKDVAIYTGRNTVPEPSERYTEERQEEKANEDKSHGWKQFRKLWTATTKHVNWMVECVNFQAKQATTAVSTIVQERIIQPVYDYFYPPPPKWEPEAKK